MGLAVSLIVAASAYAVLAFAPSRATLAASSTSPPDPMQTPSLSFEYRDFFDVPFGEWWDYRNDKYGDLPINALCFAPTTCANPSQYPYTNWYPAPGSIRPGGPGNNPFVYAPYRFSVAGTEIPGYSLAQPVYFPVLNPAAAAGTQLDFDWRMQYLTRAQADALAALGCPVSGRSLDGFNIRSQITVTLDLQESKRIFGVNPAITTAAGARSWWSSATTGIDPACLSEGGAEAAVGGWFVSQGGPANSVGPYDIANSFEYYYYSFYTQMTASVADSGVTTVTIDHVAWGTEVLLARWFYWGAATYAANYLDSSQRQGWWGMELGWFEDFVFAGSFGTADHDFSLSSIMQYHFQLSTFPAANGFDRVDDIPFWTWGPILTDYTNDWSPKHLVSELDRYVGPDGTPCNADDTEYLKAVPGSPLYGQNVCYDFVPITWDLQDYETLRFTFPTTDVVYYDPNLTPLGSDPTTGAFVEIRAPLTYHSTTPGMYGSWDPIAGMWTLTGPTTTGGLPGSPGNYPLFEQGAIRFSPGTGLLRATTNPAVPTKIYVDGVPRDEWGLTWVKMAPGPHTVSFGELVGLGAPAPQPINIQRGQTTVVEGSYAIHASLRVTTEPAVPSTISLNGIPRNDWGMWSALPAGTYTISFGLVAGFTPPAPITVTLAPGEFRHVPGPFTATPGAPGPDPSSFGLLRATTNPASPAVINVDGVPRDQWGLTWVKLAPGMYTISFTTVYGLEPPAPVIREVRAMDTTVYDGLFVRHGSLRVTTDPALAATVFVDGMARNDWGMWQSMRPGTYRVQFEPVAGYNTPAAQIVTVTEGALTPVVGTYTPSASTPASGEPATSAVSAGPPGPAAAVASSSRPE